MEIFKIISIALLTCFLSIIIKNIKPEFHIPILLIGGTIILLMVIDQLKEIVNYILNIFSKTNLDYSMFISILKILGVGYLTEFASGICIDSGNTSIADKVLIAGKIIILCLSLPIITNLLDIIVSLL
ncbi:MAG: stage III sporulation protein AD [Clostridia bacterium]|nr:stage III sporulation protein AD [Clostridia bacterium]